MAAKPARAKKIMAQGVGPSKIHRDPHAPDPYRHLRGLHVGGTPIEDLPENMVARLSYEHTDEAIAERNQGKVASAARVTKDPLQKKIEQRGDFRSEQMEPWEAPDPMKEVVERHIQPGMSPKFLSPSRIRRDGLRGFEVVKDSRGDPVKLGELVLGQMPVAKVEQRNRVYRNKGQAQLGEIRTQFQEGQQRLARGGSPRPMALADEDYQVAGRGLHSSLEDDD